jgi:hypothetical protein
MNTETQPSVVTPAEPKVMKQRKKLNQWGRDELLKLPTRAWGEVSEYDSLLLLSTRRKHDSGWAIMAIIGVREHQPVEIACACCDDIEWKLPPMQKIGGGVYSIGQMRMDCAMRSGALHAWARDAKFRVGMALSSTEVELLAA